MITSSCLMEEDHPTELNTGLQQAAHNRDTNYDVTDSLANGNPSLDRYLVETGTGDRNNNVISKSLTESRSADEVFQNSSVSKTQQSHRQDRKARNFSYRQFSNRCPNSVCDQSSQQGVARVSKSCTKQCDILRANYETTAIARLNDSFCSLYQAALNSDWRSESSEDYGPILFDDDNEEDMAFYRGQEELESWAIGADSPHDEEANESSSKEDIDECIQTRNTLEFNRKGTPSNKSLTDAMISGPGTMTQSVCVDLNKSHLLSTCLENSYDDLRPESTPQTPLEISTQTGELTQTKPDKEGNRQDNNSDQVIRVCNTNMNDMDKVLGPTPSMNNMDHTLDNEASRTDPKRPPLPRDIREAIMRAVANGDFDDVSSVQVDVNGYLLHENRSEKHSSLSDNPKPCNNENKDLNQTSAATSRYDTTALCLKVSAIDLDEMSNTLDDRKTPYKPIEHNDIFHSGKRIDVMSSNFASTINSPRREEKTIEHDVEKINGEMEMSAPSTLEKIENEELLSKILDNNGVDQRNKDKEMCSLEKGLQKLVCSELELDSPKDENMHDTDGCCVMSSNGSSFKGHDGVKKEEDDKVCHGNTTGHKEDDWKSKFIPIDWPNEEINGAIIDDAYPASSNNPQNVSKNDDDERISLGSNLNITEGEKSIIKDTSSRILSARPKTAAPRVMTRKRKKLRKKNKNIKTKTKDPAEETKPESKFLSLLLTMMDDDKAEGTKQNENTDTSHSVRFNDVIKTDTKADNAYPKFPRGVDLVRPTEQKDETWIHFTSKRNNPKNKLSSRLKKRPRLRRHHTSLLSRSCTNIQLPGRSCDDTPRASCDDTLNDTYRSSCDDTPGSLSPPVADAESVQGCPESTGGTFEDEISERTYLDLAPFSKKGEDKYSLLKDYYLRKHPLQHDPLLDLDISLADFERKQTMPETTPSGIRISKVNARVSSVVEAHRIKNLTQYASNKPGYEMWNYPRVDGYKSEKPIHEELNVDSVAANDKHMQSTKCLQLYSGDNRFQDGSSAVNAKQKRLLYTNLLQMHARERQTNLANTPLKKEYSTSKLSQIQEAYRNQKQQHKVRFVGLSVKRIRQNEDPWNSTVNEMLLKSNKAIEGNKWKLKEDYNRFPRSDSAHVVCPVPKKSFTFLNELLEQDSQEQLGGQKETDKLCSSLKQNEGTSAAILLSNPVRNMDKIEPNLFPDPVTYFPKERSLVKLPSIHETTRPLVNQSPTSGKTFKLHTDLSEIAHQKMRNAHLSFSHLEPRPEAARSPMRAMSPPSPRQKSPRHFERHVLKNLSIEKAHTIHKAQLKGEEEVELHQNKRYRRWVPRVVPESCRKPQPKKNRAPTNYLLNQHSDVFNYYTSPFLRDRDKAIVQMYGE